MSAVAATRDTAGQRQRAQAVAHDLASLGVALLGDIAATTPTSYSQGAAPAAGSVSAQQSTAIRSDASAHGDRAASLHVIADSAATDAAESVEVTLAATPPSAVAGAQRVRIQGRYSEQQPIPLPEPLVGLSLEGGLRRAAISSMSHSPLLAVEVIATALAHGNYVAVVGWPSLLYTQLLERRIDLSRLLVIPDPGEHPLRVIGMLSDGVDLICYHATSGQAERPRRFPATALRPTAARIRQHNAALLLINTDTRGHSFHQHIDATVIGYHGLRYGRGRISSVEMVVSIAGKAGSKQTRAMIHAGGMTTAIAAQPYRAKPSPATLQPAARQAAG